MLSHHELATLMSLGEGEHYLDPFDLDVLALRQYELVEVAQRTSHGAIVQLTLHGRQFLDRLRPVRAHRANWI